MNVTSKTCRRMPQKEKIYWHSIACLTYNNELKLRNMPRLTFKIQGAPICGLAIGYVEKCLVILLPFVTIEIYKKP